MIDEQEFTYQEKIDDIYKEIYEKGFLKNSKMTIKYYGNKNQFQINDSQKKLDNQEIEKNEINKEDPRNSLLFIEYEDIYIGAISINNLHSRENFGFNIYSKDSYYIGQWKDNMKEGIGFLKINEDLMYIGNFECNQFNGFGISYNKKTGDYFFGEFNNGAYEEGIFFNELNEYFYRGKIKDGKKNDKLCTFFDSKNGYMFVGEIIENEFNKGYVGICQITEEKGNEEEEGEGEILNFNVQKIFFFEGSGTNNKTFIHYYAFTSEFYAKIQDIMNNIFQADYNLKDQNENILEYFNYLESIQSNNDYQNLENYNSFQENEQSIENEFISNYYRFYHRFKNGQENLDLKEYENFLEQPETNYKFEE